MAVKVDPNISIPSEKPQRPAVTSKYNSRSTTKNPDVDPAFKLQLSSTAQQASAKPGELPQNSENDSFYGLKGINSSMTESEDFYTLTGTIPEHEQPNTTVSVDKDRVTINLRRKNMTSFNSNDGYLATTQGSETIREEFRLPMKVDPNRSVVKFEGTQLVIIIPKIKTPVPTGEPA